MASILIEQKRQALPALLKHYKKLQDFAYLCDDRGSLSSEIAAKYKKTDPAALADIKSLRFIEAALKHDLFSEEERYIYELDSKGLRYPVYRYLECVFRQVMMFTGNFKYTSDRFNPDLFKKGLSPKRRIELLEKQISTSEIEAPYGLGKIIIDKFGLIQRTEKEFADKLGELEDLLHLCQEKSSTAKGVSSDFNLHDELVKSETSLINWVHKEIQVGDFNLREFISVDRRSKKISFQKSKFIYFSLYTLAAKGVFEPHFKVTSNRADRASGIFGFIAKKLNFELGDQVDTKFTSQFPAKRYAASKSIQEWEEIASSQGIVDKDFYDHLLEMDSQKKFSLPYQCNEELARLESLKS